MPEKSSTSEQKTGKLRIQALATAGAWICLGYPFLFGPMDVNEFAAVTGIALILFIGNAILLVVAFRQKTRSSLRMLALLLGISGLAPFVIMCGYLFYALTQLSAG